jgi:hypothetical protein
MMSPDIAPRRHGAPPSSFTAFHEEGPHRVHEATDGARLREYLVHLGVLVPADVVTARPVRDPWIESPPTCRLLGSEDHRIPDHRPPW